MDLPILSYYISDDEVCSTCDFVPHQNNDATTYYEVIRVINSVPLFCEDHIQRLFTSIELSGSSLSLSEKNIKKRILALIQYNNLETGNIKFQIIEKNNNFVFTAFIVPAYYPSIQEYNNGVKTATINKTRTDPNQKILNSEFRRKTEAFKLSKKVYETLLTNNSNITEGSKSNVFFISNKCLLTPESEHVLPGITRHYVIKAANNLGIEFKEKEIHINDLPTFNAAFLTGTSIKILPICSIDEINFETNNILVSSMQKEYENMINDYISNFKN